MRNTRPLEVVFLTSFTDYSHRSIPAIAQMADELSIRLTIVHALCGAPRNGCAEAQAEAQLYSFFPEADLYTVCTRRLMPGTPIEAVKQLRETQEVDLVIAPAADPLGLPRIGHRSLRARLLRECGIPLWTIGRRTDPVKLRTPVRNVACWIDLEDDNLRHFAYALEYSWKLDVPLHILHAVPEVNEGVLAAIGRPLHEDGAIDEIRKRVGWSPVPLQYHVAPGSGSKARKTLMDDCCADVVFVADRPPVLGTWLPLKPRILDDCACPVICIPSQLQVPVWNLEHERRRVPAEAASFARPGGQNGHGKAFLNRV